HGVQFRASFPRAAAPTTIEGIEKYLGSGMIRGIGPIYAKKLVRTFGDAVFDVIRQEPSRLREVTGIGPKRAQRIIAGWAEQKVIREIMLFLHSNSVGTSRAVRIYKTYDAAYSPGDSGLWVKVKCQNREEFVVVGWTDPEGARPWLGALLLAYYDPDGRVR